MHRRIKTLLARLGLKRRQRKPVESSLPSKCYIERLPVELVKAVLESLPNQEETFKRLRLVSRLWKSLVEELDPTRATLAARRRPLANVGSRCRPELVLSSYPSVISRPHPWESQFASHLARDPVGFRHSFFGDNPRHPGKGEWGERMAVCFLVKPRNLHRASKFSMSCMLATADEETFDAWELCSGGPGDKYTGHVMCDGSIHTDEPRDGILAGATRSLHKAGRDHALVVFSGRLAKDEPPMPVWAVIERLDKGERPPPDLAFKWQVVDERFGRNPSRRLGLDPLEEGQVRKGLLGVAPVQRGSFTARHNGERWIVMED